MNWLTALLLAAVAGITDVLPVSGTAHLLILEKLLGLQLSQAAFLTYRSMVHLGLALALLLFYHRRVWEMLRTIPWALGARTTARRRKAMRFGRRLLMLQLLSALPMVFALFLDGLRLRLEANYYLPVYLCVFCCLNGILLYFSGRGALERRELQEASLEDSLLVGLAQVPTVLPGLSRSGFSTSIALLQGFRWSAAVEYTGLMGIPTFLAAGLVERVRAAKAGAAGLPGSLQLGILAMTALTALLTLRILTEQAAPRRPTGLAFWCWGIGIFSLSLFLIAA